MSKPIFPPDFSDIAADIGAMTHEQRAVVKRVAARMHALALWQLAVPEDRAKVRAAFDAEMAILASLGEAKAAAAAKLIALRTRQVLLAALDVLLSRIPGV